MTPSHPIRHRDPKCSHYWGDKGVAHAVKDPNGRAYNRTAHLPERKRMMQAWADYLDGLKKGADILPFRREG